MNHCTPTHKPCDLCIEQKCEKVGKCNCKTCKSKDCCPKYLGLQVTIRITTKCTQSCSHCCYSSSPKSNDFMTVEMSEQIGLFLKNNPIYYINLMGGEIYCHPQYQQILKNLIPNVQIARIVSNGDWANDHPEFAEFISQFPNAYVSISKDKYHTNKHIDKAKVLLESNGVSCKVADLEEKGTDQSLGMHGNVPIGRSLFEYGFYSSFGCYCHNPEHEYSFLIDELGKIYKCGFGVWDYDNIDDYLNGGFAERFQEFSKKFYSIFIPNCASCIRASYNASEKTHRKSFCIPQRLGRNFHVAFSFLAQKQKHKSINIYYSCMEDF